MLCKKSVMYLVYVDTVGYFFAENEFFISLSRMYILLSWQLTILKSGINNIIETFTLSNINS